MHRDIENALPITKMTVGKIFKVMTGFEWKKISRTLIFKSFSYNKHTRKVPFSSAKFPIQTLRKKSWQAGCEMNCLLSDLTAIFKQFASPNCSCLRISNTLVFFSSASKHSVKTPIARSPNSLKCRFLFMNMNCKPPCVPLIDCLWIFKGRETVLFVW